MPKKNAPSPQPQTHFETVPLEVVAKIAEIDTPLELTRAPVESTVQPPPPKPASRTKK
jgi:hypothetical protein